MVTVTNKVWLTFGLVACMGLVQPVSTRADDLPTSGMPVPELAVFDQTMQDFMAERDIWAGLLGIMKDGCIVYERGFGWKGDYHQGGLLPEDAMMRIASCGKPITAAAIRKLANTGAISLGDFVFDLSEDGEPPTGILNYTPLEEPVDPRLDNITVQNLIDHRSGWDRSTDPTYKEIEIADLMGVPSPPGRIRTARFAMNIPLWSFPGSPNCDANGEPLGCHDGDQYSNLGYMLLGLILEQESGMDYIDFVRSYVFGPIPGELGTSIVAGATFPEDQSPREPWYDDYTWKHNVFDPDGPYVFWPYGGWDHEARIAQGGLVAATEPLLRFMEYYKTDGTPITGDPPWGSHTGSMPAGTRALTRQRGDGINYVVLFNKREMDGDSGYCADGTTCMGDADCPGDCIKSWAAQVRTILDGVIDAGGIDWPTRCIDGAWVDFDHAPSGTGNFADPFNTLNAGLANTPAEARMQIKSGGTNWTGTISQRVKLHAPLGPAVIGTATP